MNQFFKNELDKSVDELRNKQPEFSKKQLDIIKSLPEKERQEIFRSMYVEKQDSSPYQMWLDLNRGWKNFIKIIILVALITSLILFGTKTGWKNFKEFFYLIGNFY